LKTTHVNCGDCDKNLLDVLVQPSETPIDWTIVAHCPFCGGKSYKKKFSGLLRIANGERTEIDHDDEIDSVTHFYLAIRN
jgi:RNA polymerase subunit RPABC4/transcription elongation factor Spt4